MKRTLGIAVLVAFVGVGTMQTAPQATDIKKSYSDVVKDWEMSEKLSVSPKAEKAIVSAFAQYDPEFIDGSNTWSNSRRTLKQTLLICYLDRMRDRLPSFEVVEPGKRRPPPEDREMELEDGGTYDIERYDIARYTVDTFVRDIRPVLAGHKGELVVVPDQVPSIITVDGYEIGHAGTISLESARE